MPKTSEKESGGRASGTTASKKKSKSGGSSSSLRSVVAGAASADALIDLVERLGLVEMVLGRIKARLEETDIDELFEDIADYMKRNPEVLVVSLASLTVATGLVVWLNSRREWDGTERRRATAAASRGGNDDDDDDDDEPAAPSRTRRTS